MRADFTLDYDVLTVERPQKLYLLARLFAAGDSSQGYRRPLNLSLVIDRSGSMAGAKIDFTRQAAQFLVQHLSPRDILSIVLYNDQIETLLPPESVSNKDRIRQLLDRITVRGTTNMSGGWLEGCMHLSENLTDDRLSRVILMTDGLANRGITETDRLVSMARQKLGEGITTTTMGLGEDFNEDLLMAMAAAGGGAFYFIDSPEVAPSIFNEELRGLLSVVGQNLVITLTPGPDVSFAQQLNAYPESKTEQVYQYRLGDIIAEELKTLVLEISVPALQSLGLRKIATLRFDYDEITGGQSRHHVSEMDVMVNVRTPDEPSPLPDPEVSETVFLLRAASARREAVHAADRGDYDKAVELLREVADDMAQSAVQNKRLNEERQALLAQAERLTDGDRNFDRYSRKTMYTQALYTMTDRHDATVMLRMREQERRTIETKSTGSQAAGDPNAVKPQPGVTPTHLSWNGQLYELKGELIRLGRSSHNEIVIHHESVSRFHAQIRRDGDRLFLEDVGSTNGTLVNGKTLDAAHELQVGDEAQLSGEKLIFRLELP